MKRRIIGFPLKKNCQNSNLGGGLVTHQPSLLTTNCTARDRGYNNTTALNINIAFNHNKVNFSKVRQTRPKTAKTVLALANTASGGLATVRGS